MNLIQRTAAAVALGTATFSAAQGIGQAELKIDSTNRTISVTATESVSMEPDVAILHVGFQTAPADARQAYADGTRTSNAIIAALKQAGVAEGDIRSQSQYLEPDYSVPKQHKYKLTQQWTVHCTPERAAEMLDVAVDAGANSSGAIEWNVKDPKDLEQQALDKAAGRARENAATLAKAMGVGLGRLVYANNEMAGRVMPQPMMRSFAMKDANANGPLAVEPAKVSREATVHAVFAIE